MVKFISINGAYHDISNFDKPISFETNGHKFTLKLNPKTRLFMLDYCNSDTTIVLGKIDAIEHNAISITAIANKFEIRGNIDRDFHLEDCMNKTMTHFVSGPYSRSSSNLSIQSTAESIDCLDSIVYTKRKN